MQTPASTASTATARPVASADLRSAGPNGRNGQARAAQVPRAPLRPGPVPRGGGAPGVPAGLTLRPALPGDFEPLSFFFDTALRNDYFVRRGQLREILAARHHQVYVAEIDAVLVGVAITTRGSRLVNALVHPGYRGLGIGRALIEFTRATEVRCKHDMSTGDPRDFYTALGFAPTGRRNGKGNIELLRRRRAPTGTRHAPGPPRAAVAKRRPARRSRRDPSAGRRPRRTRRPDRVQSDSPKGELA